MVSVPLPVIALLFALFAALPASAQDIWTGGDASNSTNWTDGLNWQAGIAPLPYDSLDFSGIRSANSNGFPSGTAFDGITFDGGAAVGFNLTGNSILLSGNISSVSNGVVNNSGVAQAVGLSLNLDWGYHTIVGGNPDGLSLNGAFALTLGGVAYFDPYVTASGLTADSSGLIAGLGGAGLMYNSGSPAIPTNLASVSGGAIVAYTGYTTVASGNIPSSAVNNLELTATGTATTYSNTVGAGTIFANTITVSQAGGANNSDVTTILTNATGATLALGTNNAGTGPYIGGIYVLNSQGTNHADFTLNGGHLTAGPMSGTATPGTIVIAVNGANANNQAQINSIIQNNGSGGAVTVVTAGTGSQYFSTANTYTGGTYITEGQLQASSSTSAFGTGPVYVASGATVYLAAGGTYANSFYLSPGLGDTIGSGAILNPGSLAWGASVTLSGKITLQGAPATTGHGDRIAGNNTGGAVTISGQITGPGTLEFGGAHTGSYTLSNTGANSNNWQGGLTFYANTGVAVNVSLKMGANNQIPSGPNAGNVTLIPPGSGSGVYTSLNLNGYNATINGLSSPTLASQSLTYQAMISDGDPLATSTGNSTLTLGANDATATFNGISTNRGGGLLSLVKVGLGTQTFTGPLSHGGNTTVSNGVFQLESTMPNSPVIAVAAAGTLDASQGPNNGLTVASNQTLAGTGTVLGSTTINGTVAAIMAVSGATTNIGTLTNNGLGGMVTLNGGATNIWYVVNANGTAGSASGWSLMQITNASLALNASVSSPIHIKIVSLTSSGAPGNATFNPNINQSWTLMQSYSPISGFTGSSQFVIDTSAFGNLPSGSSQFSVGTDATGDNLVLYFTSAPLITSVLVNQTNNAGSSAVFTVSAAGPTPITYQWVEAGTTVLVNGGTSLGGGTVTVTTNVADTTSTLTIAHVEDADAGPISVFVTNSAAETGVSTATLTVIDPPSSPTITPTGQTTTASAGGVTDLNATANGTPPFTYSWSFDGAAISGATNSTLAVNLSPASVGSYTVVLGNAAGSVTNAPYVIGPVTVVPNQLIYEPFTSYTTMSGPFAPYTWEGVTNVFNQLTGEPAFWQHESGSRVSMVIEQNSFNTFTANNAPGYPWPGLAGNSSQCMDLEVNSSQTDNDQMYFWSHGVSPGQSLYFSFILNCDTLGGANVSDVIAAFCDSSSSTSFNLKLSTQIQTDGSYWLGLSKGSGVTGNQGVDANTLWATGFQPDQDVFVVGLYQANSGLNTTNDDTVAVWFNPTNTSFGATNIPAPTFGPTNFGVNNSGIHAFSIHGVQYPGNRYFSDLRIGTTWASVTPISAPNLTLTNVSIVPGVASVTLTSQNAGNPVTSAYQWYFNGTNGTPLADGPNPTGDGSLITNSTTSALTIIRPTAADLGAYTVTGSNTDPAPADNGATLADSATATLSFLSPLLNVAYQTPNVIISWPTNWSVFTLQQNTSLSSTNWTSVPAGSYVVSGANETYTTSPAGASQFFRLIGP